MRGAFCEVYVCGRARACVSGCLDNIICPWRRRRRRLLCGGCTRSSRTANQTNRYTIIRTNRDLVAVQSPRFYQPSAEPRVVIKMSCKPDDLWGGCATCGNRDVFVVLRRSVVGRKNLPESEHALSVCQYVTSL